MKKLAYIFVIVLVLGICFVVGDRRAAQTFKSNSGKIKVEVGDILFRSYSYTLANSSFYTISGLPGHLAIVISEGEIVLNSNSLTTINVVEARYFDRAKGEKPQKVGINLASENFGDTYLGRRFLLKTHLTPLQKQELINFYQQHLHKPYNFFAKKDDTSEYNCATFARQVLLAASGIDIDSNGGKIFFPNDIFNCPLFLIEENRIHF